MSLTPNSLTPPSIINVDSHTAPHTYYYDCIEKSSLPEALSYPLNLQTITKFENEPQSDKVFENRSDESPPNHVLNLHRNMSDSQFFYRDHGYIKTELNTAFSEALKYEDERDKNHSYLVGAYDQTLMRKSDSRTPLHAERNDSVVVMNGTSELTLASHLLGSPTHRPSYTSPHIATTEVILKQEVGSPQVDLAGLSPQNLHSPNNSSPLPSSSPQVTSSSPHFSSPHIVSPQSTIPVTVLNTFGGAE